MTPVANRYLLDRVMTATPAQLIGMIFDVAVRSLDAAKKELLDGTRLEVRRHLLKAQDAVTELRCALLTGTGDKAIDDMSGNLDAIYEYVFLKLVKSAMGQDDRGIDECGRLLGELRDAWRTGCLDGPVQQQVAALGVA